MSDAEIECFGALYRFADNHIAEADKEDVAKTARILALNLAPYQVKYGGATRG